MIAPRALPPEVLAGVRARLPALATDWALFDNAGGSVPVDGVIARVHDHMSRLGVQLGASHALSVEATARVIEGHRAAERLLGAEPGEVILGSSTTANLRTMAHAFGATLSPGDAMRGHRPRSRIQHRGLAHDRGARGDRARVAAAAGHAGAAS
jgi:selenocysteine lyase/cysteine desulfurase